MSEDSAAVEAERSCANCGVKEIDNVKLSDCLHCDRAQYCGDECQQNHREIHEAICKERAAEFRDEILFKQNESSHFGDCPICCLPIPLEAQKSITQSCCGKLICRGCSYANGVREMKQRLEPKCAFCRKPIPDDTEADREHNRNFEKRAAVNDPVALLSVGELRYEEGGYDIAFEYYTRAAELGDARAHYVLSILHREGQGVERDEEMEIYHLEEAAIAGHPDARYDLAVYELKNVRIDRAVKHFIIAANLGHDESLHQLKKGYKVGLVSKDDLAAALRAYQAAVDAMKSPQREEIEKFHAWLTK